jgi:small subunit ribosomal protein S16
MVKIRLFRTGAKKKPSYRVVIADSRAPRNGRFIEIIGQYNPRTDPVVAEIEEDRALYWLSVGAQPTDQVNKILKNLGTLDRFAQVKEGADLESVLAAAAQEKATQSSTETKKKPAAPTPSVEVEEEKPAESVESTEESSEEVVADVPEEVSAEATQETPDEVISDEDES